MRTLPSACSATIAPTESSMGTAGSTVCSCNRSIRSVRSASRLRWQWRRIVSGRPSGAHPRAPRGPYPALVATTRSWG